MGNFPSLFLCVNFTKNWMVARFIVKNITKLVKKHMIFYQIGILSEKQFQIGQNMQQQEKANHIKSV